MHQQVCHVLSKHARIEYLRKIQLSLGQPFDKIQEKYSPSTYLIMSLEPYTESIRNLICKESFILSFVIGKREFELEGRRDISAVRNIQQYSCFTSLINGRIVKSKTPFINLNRANLFVGQVIQTIALSKGELGNRSDIVDCESLLE